MHLFKPNYHCKSLKATFNKYDMMQTINTTH